MTLLKIPGVFSGMASRYELFGLMVRKDPDLGNVSWHRVSFLRRQLVTLLKIPGVCLGTTSRFGLFGLMVREDPDLGNFSQMTKCFILTHEFSVCIVSPLFIQVTSKDASVSNIFCGFKMSPVT